MLKTSAASFSHRSGPQRGPSRLTTRWRAQTQRSLFVIRRTVRPRGYTSALYSLRPCPRNVASLGKEAILADSGQAGEKSGLFDHPSKRSPVVRHV